MSKVFFTKEITSESLQKLYSALNTNLSGKIGIKVHTGESDAGYFIKPSLMDPLVKSLNGTYIETNVAYHNTERANADTHKNLAKRHGFANIDILDEDGDLELEIPNGKFIKTNYVGKHINNYDSFIVMSHFKAMGMGGFGAALKNVGIGFASRVGKKNIHGSGVIENFFSANPDKFLYSMLDATKSVIDYKKNFVFINFIMDMLTVCDCNKRPEKPEMQNIGICASLDPVAIDQASYDLIVNANDDKKEKYVNQLHKNKLDVGQLTIAEEVGLGSRKYELVNID